MNYHEEDSKEIRLKVVYRSTTNFLNDYTANISIGGCFLSTQQPFKIGETIELAMILPTGQYQCDRGCTMGLNGLIIPGVGVRFTVLSNRDKSLIQQLLDERE